MSSLQSRSTFSTGRSALSAVSQSLSLQSPSRHSYISNTSFTSPAIQSIRATASSSYSMRRAPPATNGARIRSTAPVSMAPVSAAPVSRAPVSMAPVSAAPVSRAPVTGANLIQSLRDGVSTFSNLLNPPPPMFISPGVASYVSSVAEPDAEPHHESPNVASNTGKGFGKMNFKGSLGTNSGWGTISGWTAAPHSGWKGAGNKGGFGVGKGMMKGNGMGMKGGHSSQSYQ